MNAFGITPYAICRRATSTLAGIALAERLCGVRALDLTSPEGTTALAGVLAEALDLPHTT